MIAGGFIRLTEDGIATLGITFSVDASDTTITASGSYRVQNDTLTLELVDPEGGPDPFTVTGTIKHDTIVIDDRGDIYLFRRRD